MIDQLPYMGYVKWGSFIPVFGTKIDDHTSPIRRDFELNQDVLNSRVQGIGICVAPNYPYFNISYFNPNKKDTLYDGNPDRDKSDPPIFSGVDGSGVTLSHWIQKWPAAWSRVIGKTTKFR
ncbi:MAG: hypothetical protein R2827_05005 [Bdellovibrionales bacterium]